MRLRLGILAVAALAAAGLAAGATSRPTVLGVSWEGSGYLARLDARTLRPVGRRLDIGKPPVGLVARSPDGRTIALGHGSSAELRFVDLREMRATGRLRLGRLGSVGAAIWPAPDRLVVLYAGATTDAVVVDPRMRRVLSRRTLDGELIHAVPAGGKRLLALLAPRGAIGEARLAVIAADGTVRTVALPLSAGFAPPTTPEGVGRQASPGLAADPAGSRAVVVGNETLVTVDLETLAIPMLKHLRRPARTAKRIEGWSRSALWLPDERIVTAGYDFATSDPPATPTGVTLFDLVTGRTRELDPSASGIALAGSTLLVFGGSALRGYRLDGTLGFELLRDSDSDTGYVQLAGRFAYFGADNSTRFTVVDVRAGRVAATTRTPYPTIVLG